MVLEISEEEESVLPGRREVRKPLGECLHVKLRQVKDPEEKNSSSGWLESRRSV